MSIGGRDETAKIIHEILEHTSEHYPLVFYMSDMFIILSQSLISKRSEFNFSLVVQISKYKAGMHCLAVTQNVSAWKRKQRQKSVPPPLCKATVRKF